MPSQTTLLQVPYATGTDAVNTVDTTMQALAERVDLLAGESGQETKTPSAANVDDTWRVNYARSYAALPRVPKVLVQLQQSIGTGTVVQIFADGEDATGFTLHLRASNTTPRPIRWVCIP